MTKSFAPRFEFFIVLNSGEKIDPEEIEEIYTKSAPIKEMCVFAVSGVAGVRKSRVLWAVVQPDLENFREFNEVNLRAVIKERFDNVSQTLPLFKRLKGFTISLNALPHTFFGELKRYAIREIYEPRVAEGLEGTLPVAGPLLEEDVLLMRTDVAIKVLNCLQEQCAIQRPIHLQDSLELDLGVDSMGRIELASCLETAFNAGIAEEVISKAFTVKDLIHGITEAFKGDRISPSSDIGISLGPDYWEEHLSVLPKKENLEMLELSTGYFAWLFRFVLTAIDYAILKLFFKVKGEGAKNVPQKGAYIIYGNHSSFLDGPAIAACLPRRPVFQLFYFVFGPYFFRPFVKSPVLRNFVKMGRFIPFDFSTHFLEALRSSYFVLRHGKGLCFFPEGLRSATGEIGEFKKGFGVLAKETGAKLVPVAIEGAHEAWGSTAKYPQFRPIRVRFGQPLLPEDLEKEGLAMGSKNSYDAICVAARKALIKLKGRP